ncbi:hypothetical protein WG922_16430 [Ramlibacter sp. AN1015]|uniref:hypothetical protein n=1 Tax=Ramlibacter sp. AN1015 TaxID=3133428 RepID=UPI0030C54F5F
MAQAAAPTILPRARRAAVLCALLAASAQAQATGGHFAVTDALLLDPGACKLDGWSSRSPGRVRLLHAGGACRVGPIEIGAVGDYEREDANGSTTEWGLGITWAADLGERLAIGASLAPTWQAGARPRLQGTTAAALLSWTVDERLSLHANIGRDLVHRGPDQLRAGVAGAWKLRRHWTALLERYRAEDSHFVRGGVRWEPAPGWTVDLSRAHRIAGPGSASWTLGLTREFDRGR